MPRTAITVQTTSRDGLTASYISGDSVNGHEFANYGQDVILIINNGGGSGINATFITPNTVDGNAIADKTVAVGAGVEMFIGPFRNSVYGSAANKTTVYFDLDSATSVTVAAIALGSA